MVTLRALLTATVAVVALAGCAAAPTPAPSSTPAPAASATAEPTETAAPDAARIVLAPDGFTIVDESGDTSFSHVWADEPEPAVAALEEALGSAPEVSTSTGDGTHIADFEVYTWDGLVLASAVDLGKDRAAYFLPSSLEYRAAEVGGVELTTRAGATVGMPRADAEAIFPNQIEMWTEGRTRILIDPEDPALLNPGASEATNTVGLFTDIPGETIESITAPTASYLGF
ncbi:MAG: hypothetical protein ABW040_10485 [Microbacteriaceae bacterium]